MSNMCANPGCYKPARYEESHEGGSFTVCQKHVDASNECEKL